MMKTSVVLPNELKNDIDRRVVNDGYGFKGKSRWACEAIEELLSLNNFVEYVEIEDLINLNQKMSFSIEQDIESKLQQAIITVRRQLPSLEGVRSKIIRAAFIQRLIRGGGD